MAFPEVSLTMVKNYGSSYLRKRGDSQDGDNGPAKKRPCHKEDDDSHVDLVSSPSVNPSPAPAKHKYPEKKKSTMEQAMDEEFERYTQMIDNGDPPFLNFHDPAKNSNVTVAGVGMFFNKGNNNTSVSLNVIREIGLVHVEKIIQPPSLATYKTFSESMFEQAKSMYANAKRKEFGFVKKEYCVRIPK
eukprot:1321054-Amorphochlora_amoeboformis.AAC.2